MGATGSEPMTPSVSEISGGSWRPAGRWGVCSMTWADGGPILTVVVRCDPVVRGPDVAPMWPQRFASDPALPFVSSLAYRGVGQVRVTQVTLNDRQEPPGPAPHGTQMARRAVSLTLVLHGGWGKRHPSSTILVILEARPRLGRPRGSWRRSRRARQRPGRCAAELRSDIPRGSPSRSWGLEVVTL
jgi:hypothetical protein